jgi:hypothetical protein
MVLPPMTTHGAALRRQARHFNLLACTRHRFKGHQYKSSRLKRRQYKLCRYEKPQPWGLKCKDRRYELYRRSQ